MSSGKKCTKTDNGVEKSYHVCVYHTPTQGSSCPMKKSIHKSEEVCNRLRKKDLYETVTGYALEYIVAIIISIFSAGYRGKTVDMELHSRRHRTSISRFLRNEGWDDSELETAMKKLVIETIYEESEHIGKPVYCIIDDTIASKSIPTSMVQNSV